MAGFSTAMSLHCLSVIGAILAVTWLSPHIEAQVAEDIEEEFDIGFDSRKNPGPFSELVCIDGAPTLRLNFAGTKLAKAGDIITIESTTEEVVQTLNADGLENDYFKSAYFNGDCVLVSLEGGSQGGTKVIIPTAEVNYGSAPSSESICGADDRVQSFDLRQGRLGGCTAWLISDDVIVTAGHCNPAGKTMYFNVPLSSSNGGLNYPGPEDQYSVTAGSVDQLDAGVGSDWAVAKLNPNSQTGLKAGDAQGSWYQLGAVPISTSNQFIDITGYGVTDPRDQLSQVQKTHTSDLTFISGTYLRYVTDTTGGNSGSPIVHANTGMAVGVHTHAGCTSGGNHGTRIDRSDFSAAISNKFGGGDPPPPPGGPTTTASPTTTTASPTTTTAPPATTTAPPTTCTSGPSCSPNCCPGYSPCVDDLDCFQDSTCNGKSTKFCGEPGCDRKNVLCSIGSDNCCAGLTCQRKGSSNKCFFP